MENQEQSKPEPQNNDQDIVPITYQGIPGITFEYTDPVTKEQWIQQVVGEHMLDVRWKQFDRYCEAIDPKVEKRRIKTKRYSYNFIKESDVHRIAKAFNKVIRIPIKDIPRTDENEKIFSKTDVGSMVEGEVNHRGAAVFGEYKNLIADYKSKNETLNEEVKTLLKEKYTISSKLKNWQIIGIISLVVLVIGGGVGYLQYHKLDTDNDKTLTDNDNIQKENTGLKTMVKDLQDQYQSVMKKLTPSVQNEEINAVKKD